MNHGCVNYCTTLYSPIEVVLIFRHPIINRLYHVHYLLGLAGSPKRGVLMAKKKGIYE